MRIPARGSRGMDLGNGQMVDQWTGLWDRGPASDYGRPLAM
jgi:hypothetical protein